MSGYKSDLSHKKTRSEAFAGAKAAKLARLLHKGFPVPPGFVVSTGLLKTLLRGRAGLSSGHSVKDLLADSRRLRDLMLKIDLPGRAEREIRIAFRNLGGPVAVRSSLVGEDGPYASFAGQLDSFLHIETEDCLFEAIRKCYASVFSERFAEYVSHRVGSAVTDHADGISMAVLIQRMIEGPKAGVAFSAEPDTGRYCIIIEAVKGSGEGLVGGYAEPDRYVMNSDGVLTESRPAVQGSPVLDEPEVIELGKLVRNVSREIAMPQDVEWVLGDSGFYVLQSRPITPLAGKNVYSRKLAADMAPGLIKPLYFSTNIEDMARNVFGRVFTEALGPRDTDYTGLVKLVRSRVFANVTMFARLFGELGLPINLFEVMARDEAAIHRRPSMSLRLVRHLGQVVRLVLRYGWIAGRADKFISTHEKRLARYRSADWTGRPASDLLREIGRLRSYHGETQWYMWLTAINMTARNKMLSKFVKRRAPGVDKVSLLAGYTGLRSLEPNRDLREIAACVRALDHDLIEVLRAEGDAKAREKLGAAPGGKDIVEAFDRFMGRYGHLSASGTDFTVSPWAENADALWRNIGDLAAEPGRTQGVDVDAQREEAQRIVKQNCNWMERLYFTRLLRGTITYLRLREHLSFLMSEDAYQMRRLYLAVGAALVGQGSLDAPDDLFFLKYREIEDLVEKKLDSDIARERIQSRRMTMEMDARLELDDVICGEGEYLTPEPPPADVTHLNGIPGSAGTVRGYVRVVRDPSDAVGALKRDDVLVVPFMDIGWTPLFSAIGGIVAETGGQLSHSAIVAREYGLPAVVSVRGATRVLRDGDPITVDGSRGQVYLGHI